METTADNWSDMSQPCNMDLCVSMTYFSRPSDFALYLERLLDRKRVRLACKRPRVRSPRPACAFVETWS